MKVLIVTTLFCVAVALEANAAILYEQPPIPGNPAQNQSPVYVSQTGVFDPAQPIFDDQVWDNFTLGLDANITDIHWQGGYDLDPTQAATPEPLTFTIRFAASNGNIPGGTPTVLYSATAPIGASISETFVGTEPGLFGTVFVYNYDMPILPGGGFATAAGVEYWVSIQANLNSPDPDDPFWGWHIGTGGDGVAFQSVDGDWGTPPVQLPDMAFQLTGPMDIPEPGSVAIWLITLVGLCGFVAIKKNKKK